MCDSLDDLVGCEVVLDTPGTIVYLGKLISYSQEGFWLETADMHNTAEGHATREQYIVESARDGIRVNRQKILVFRHTVISLSALSDVITA